MPNYFGSSNAVTDIIVNWLCPYVEQNNDNTCHKAIYGSMVAEMTTFSGSKKILCSLSNVKFNLWLDLHHFYQSWFKDHCLSHRGWLGRGYHLSKTVYLSTLNTSCRPEFCPYNHAHVCCFVTSRCKILSQNLSFQSTLETVEKSLTYMRECKEARGKFSGN